MNENTKKVLIASASVLVLAGVAYLASKRTLKADDKLWAEEPVIEAPSVDVVIENNEEDEKK